MGLQDEINSSVILPPNYHPTMKPIGELIIPAIGQFECKYGVGGSVVWTRWDDYQGYRWDKWWGIA